MLLNGSCRFELIVEELHTDTKIVRAIVGMQNKLQSLIITELSLNITRVENSTNIGITFIIFLVF